MCSARAQGRVVVLGGAFWCNGNVNPAAEANIYGDPDAANLVFSRWAGVGGQAGRRAGGRALGGRAGGQAGMLYCYSHLIRLLLQQSEGLPADSAWD